MPELVSHPRHVRQWRWAQQDALRPATYHMQDENYIDKAHGRGLRAHVWTVNEKHEMKALVKAEADAIITNYPDIAVEIAKNE